MDHFQIAQEISATLARPVTYQPIDSDPTFAERLSAMGFPPHLLQHLRNVSQDYQHGIFVGTNDVVERVGGKKPLGVSDFIDKNRSIFDPPAHAVSHN
jgi:NAD(P)H dehydrogenase (quinone)